MNTTSNLLNPKVSIVIPVYNGSNFLREAIDSALAQTYTFTEVLVINDGSRDDGKTRKIALSYGNRIRYFEKQNGGVSTALNLGIENMTGEYFSWLSHDDKYDPRKIESQIAILTKLEDKTTLIYSGTVVIDASSKIVDKNQLDNNVNIQDLNKPLFGFFNELLSGCTMLVHKSHFNRVGVFDIEQITTQDYDLWFRILRDAKIYYDHNCYTYSRCHSKQTIATNTDHVENCNILWTRCFNLITENEMIKTNGSVYSFLMHSYLRFSDLGYYPKIPDLLLEKIREYFSNINRSISTEVDMREHLSLIESHRTIYNELRNLKSKMSYYDRIVNDFGYNKYINFLLKMYYSIATKYISRKKST